MHIHIVSILLHKYSNIVDRIDVVPRHRHKRCAENRSKPANELIIYYEYVTSHNDSE